MGEKLYKLDQVSIRMVQESPLYSSEPMSSPEDAARLLSDFMKDYDRELFCVVALDARMKPINIHIASMGTLDAAIVHPREVMKSLVLANAHSMMLAHNHPSGDTHPSSEDVQLTDKLAKLGELLEIPVVDHIIVSGRADEYYSFRENAVLPVEKHVYAQRPEEIRLGYVAEEGKAYGKDRVAEITEKLEQGVKDLFNSETYTGYLKTMAKFHHYSLNNTLLIALQRPDASLVAGYQSWLKDHHRQVRKGEKGIRILAPAIFKAKAQQDKIDPHTHQVLRDEQGNPLKETVEVERTSFRVTTVFDIAQTDGEPLPSLGVEKLEGDVKDYTKLLDALMATAKVPVVLEDIREHGVKGYFSDLEKKIVVRGGMSRMQTVKTLIHEMSHAALHSDAVPGGKEKDRQTKEVEAESVAFTVCQSYGIDTSDYSFGYIAGWSSGKEMPELKSSLKTIRDTADEMITEIDARLLAMERSEEKTKGKAAEAEARSLSGMEKLKDMQKQAAEKKADRNQGTPEALAGMTADSPATQHRIKKGDACR